MIVNKYYGVLLNFTSYTGFTLTNEDSRATLIFTFVFLFNLGTILGFLNIKVLEINKFILIAIFLGFFYLFYQYFSNEDKKNQILKSYKKMNLKEQILLNMLSVIFTILSVVLFLKTL